MIKQYYFTLDQSTLQIDKKVVKIHHMTKAGKYLFLMLKIVTAHFVYFGILIHFSEVGFSDINVATNGYRPALEETLITSYNNSV